jgi:hypothetical protein
MMASSGQGEISGTLSADLQQILATGDETLEAIQARLQTLSKEGVTLFNKENYFNNPRLAGSALTAQHASGSAPVLTHADPILTGRTETGLTLASGGDKQVSGVNAPNAAAANASQRTNVGALDGIEIDPRRAVVTLTSSKSQQAATRSEATHVDTIMRTSSLLADEVRRALASVKRGDAASAAREPASPVLDRARQSHCRLRKWLRSVKQLSRPKRARLVTQAAHQKLEPGIARLPRCRHQVVLRCCGQSMRSAVVWLLPLLTEQQRPQLHLLRTY